MVLGKKLKWVIFGLFLVAGVICLILAAMMLYRLRAIKKQIEVNKQSENLSTKLIENEEGLKHLKNEPISEGSEREFEQDMIKEKQQIFPAQDSYNALTKTRDENSE